MVVVIRALRALFWMQSFFSSIVAVWKTTELLSSGVPSGQVNAGLTRPREWLMARMCN